MAKLLLIFSLCLFISVSHAEDKQASIDLIEFLADWQQDDSIWLDSDSDNQAVTPAGENDHETEN